MTDTESLLREIAANPDDDTVRLAYADHLDELGGEANEAHAEYIRLQIRRHFSQGEDWDSARESHLFCTYSSHWRRAIPGFTISMSSRRGFPCGATAPASAVLAVAGDPFAAFFDEFTLVVDVATSQLNEVLRGPIVAGANWLQIAGPQAASSLRLDVFSRIPLPRLEHLILSGLSLTDIDVGWLCGGIGFPRLRELNLSSNDITGTGAEALVIAPFASRLQRLCLAGNRIGPTSAQKLSKRFGNVLYGGLP